MSERDEREMIEKNMSLSIEFSKYIFEHPEFDDKIQLAPLNYRKS